jgi:6-phospho-beta-glucosidase
VTKFLLIGGASAYTPDILLGFLRQRSVVEGWEVWLHDVDGSRLTLMGRLAERLAAAAGVHWQVRTTLDRREAIQGADFILTQPRAGGLQARRQDERIPRALGLIGQETLGAGGFAFAWRTIPVILGVMAEVQELAPKAWVINYANPAGMVTEAVIRRFPGARFIGLCDMPAGLLQTAAGLLRVDPRRVTMDWTGINHAGWGRRLYVDGVDGLGRIRTLGRLGGMVAGLLPLNEVTGTLRLFRRFDLLPDAYLRYYYHTDEMLALLARKKQTRAEQVLGRLPALYAHYEAVADGREPGLKLHRGHSSHADLASQVILAMATGRPARFIIQQENRGQLPDLPVGRAAQFPALVGPEGWEPIPQEPISDELAALLREIQAAEGLNVEAALTGDRAKAVAAMTAAPLVRDGAKAALVVERLLAAHRPYLPQFWGEGGA